MSAGPDRVGGEVDADNVPANFRARGVAFALPAMKTTPSTTDSSNAISAAIKDFLCDFIS